MTLVDGDTDDTGGQASGITQETAPSKSQAQIAPEKLTLEASVDSQCLFDFGKKVKWTKQDISQREKLDSVFMAFMNASCLCKFALEYLQEDVNNPDLEYRRPLD